MKLHLTARAPNEGARLLANWVLHRHGGDLANASSVLIISPMVIQRIVAGKLTPGDLIGANLSRHIGIVSTDFAPVKNGLPWRFDCPLKLAKAA